MNANSSVTNKNGLYLVTGTSGTGKSTVCKIIEQSGIKTLDGDSIANWADRKTGLRPKKTHPTDADWVNNHLWVWDENRLYSLHQQSSDEVIFLAGSADHMDKYWHLFKKVFLLELTAEETKERVMNRTSHDYGKGEGQMEAILTWRDELSDLALKLGAVRVDASPPADTVANFIMKQV